MNTTWPWVAVSALGAYHGLDPSMGWLFAVALGLQERRRSKVLWALGPIAAGHLVSIGAVVFSISALGLVLGQGWLRGVAAGALILFGMFRLIWPRAHPQWSAMRVNSLELGLWSFLMASAHGAGLMLFPILIGMNVANPAAMHGGFAVLDVDALAQGAGVVGIHTGAMLLVMGTVAILVYEKLGLRILRSAWINLDTLWAGALILAGVLSLIV